MTHRCHKDCLRTAIRTWSVRAAVLAMGLLLPPLAGTAQGLRLLGIPVDTLLATKTPRVDARYVATYYRRLHLYLVSDRQRYILHPAQTPLTYRPNLAWTLGAGIDFRWVGAELTLKLPIGYDVQRQGQTKPFGLSFNANNRWFWFSGQYQFYRGFYVRNPEVLQPDWFDTHTAYPYRNDLRSQTLTGSVLYMTNPLQVSVPASLLQREGPKKAAGSWLVGGRITYQYLRGDSALVPPQLEPRSADAMPWQRYRIVNLGIDGGYMQTFVLHRHFFTTLALRPGIAVLLQRLSAGDEVSATRIRPGWYGVASFTLGYTSDRYYGGLYSSVTLLERSFDQRLISADTQYIRLVFGRRLRYRPRGVVQKLPGM